MNSSEIVTELVEKVLPALLRRIAALETDRTIIQNELAAVANKIQTLNDMLTALTAQPTPKKRRSRKAAEEPNTETVSVESRDEETPLSEALEATNEGALDDPLSLTPEEIETCKQMAALGVVDGTQVESVYGIPAGEYERFLRFQKEGKI